MFCFLTAALLQWKPTAGEVGRGWPAQNEVLPADGTFPEAPVEGGCGLAVSGGGARAYGAALVQLQALRATCRDYAAGISGGSWALAVSRYGRDVDLGATDPPELLTLETVFESNRETARSFPSRDGGMFHRLRKLAVDLRNTSLAKLWVQAVEETYLEPAGAASSLSDTSSEGPFPLFGISIWAPDKSSHGMITATPSYVGQAADVPSFDSNLGGLVSSDVFDCSFAQGSQEIHGVECRTMTLSNAVAASSWALGALAAGGDLGLIEGYRVRYFAPGREAFWAELADGGNVENVHLSALIQRGVTRLFVFLNSVVPLGLDWDPFERSPSPDFIADDFSAFFGFPKATSSYNYSDLQLFPRTDFAPLVTALQTSARSGRGAVATFTHVTLRNDLLGVAPGQVLNVTWCYLADSPAWRSKLPALTQFALDRDPLFRNFPHYGTDRLDLGVPEINALASLVAFVIQRNPAHFDQ